MAIFEEELFISKEITDSEADPTDTISVAPISGATVEVNHFEWSGPNSLNSVIVMEWGDDVGGLGFYLVWKRR